MPRFHPRLRELTLAVTLAAAAGLAAAAPRRGSDRVHAEGPPPGHTGGFGEPSCRECHAGEVPDEPRGALTVVGLPDRWEAGRSYPLEVHLRHAELARAGFQLAIRFAPLSPSAGAPAGTFAVPEPTRVAIVRHDSSGVTYLQHTHPGTDVVGHEAVWAFVWTAPAAGGDVQINAAGNAANDDNSPFGDFIYTFARAVPAPR